MQSYNITDELVRSKVISNFDEVRNELNEPDVAYLTVGSIPKIGYTFELTGLKFKVVMSNSKKGRFTAELL